MNTNSQVPGGAHPDGKYSMYSAYSDDNASPSGGPAQDGSAQYLQNQQQQQQSSSADSQPPAHTFASDIKVYARSFVACLNILSASCNMGNFNAITDTMAYVTHTDAPYMPALANALFLAGTAVGAISSDALLKHVTGGSPRRALLVIQAFAVLGYAMCQFAQALWPLFIGRTLLGVYYGLGLVVSSVYVREFSPLRVRGACLSILGLIISVGILCSFLMQFGVDDDPTRNGTYWRVMLGYPIVFSIAQAVLLAFVYALDTPWQYVREEYHARALTAALQVYAHESEARAALQDAADEMDAHRRAAGDSPADAKLIAGGEPSLHEIVFSPRYRRQFFVALSALLAMPLSGISVLTMYSTQIFGLVVSFETSKVLSVLQVVLQVVFSFVSAGVLDRFGRKNVFFWVMVVNFVQSSALTVCAFLVQASPGGGGGGDTSNRVEGGIMVACIMLYFVCAGLAIATVPYVLVAEILPRAGISAANFIMNIINAGVVYAFKVVSENASMGISFTPILVFNFLYLPVIWIVYRETKGLSQQQIQDLY